MTYRANHQLNNDTSDVGLPVPSQAAHRSAVRIDRAPGEAIRVLVVGHVRLHRESLMMALHGRGPVAIVGAGDDYFTTLAQVSALAPDVVMVDMTAPGALEIISGIRGHASAAKTIAVAVPEDEAQIVACVEAGAAAYVTCDAAIELLVDVIERVNRDELVCPPKIAATLVRRLAARAAASEPAGDGPRLTTREQQVLELLRAGLTNKEIGQSLNIAEATVKHHVHQVLDKLGVRSRQQAAARFAYLAGM